MLLAGRLRNSPKKGSGGPSLELLCPGEAWRERYKAIVRAKVKAVQAQSVPIHNNILNQRLLGPADPTATLARELELAHQRLQLSRRPLAKKANMESSTKCIAEKMENRTLTHAELMKYLITAERVEKKQRRRSRRALSNDSEDSDDDESTENMTTESAEEEWSS